MGRTPLTAIDAINPDGTLRRSLTFMTEQGLSESRFFDENSMAIICGPREMYDWYGRPVEISGSIESVISAYGSEIDGITPSNANQTFITKKTNGKYAIAILKLEEESETIKEKMPQFKRILTGGFIGKKPVLEATEWEFDGIDYELMNSLVMQAYIKNRPSYITPSRIDAFSSVRDSFKTSGSTYTVLRTPEDYGFGTWICHCFVPSRDLLFETAVGKEPPQTHANYVVGDITVSKDGVRMYARAPFADKKGRTKIATDIDVLNHMKGIGIYWYYC